MLLFRAHSAPCSSLGHLSENMIRPRDHWEIVSWRHQASFHTHSKSHQEHRLLPWGLGAPAVHLAEQVGRRPDGACSQHSCGRWAGWWNGDRRGPVMANGAGTWAR